MKCSLFDLTKSMIVAIMFRKDILTGENQEVLVTDERYSNFITFLSLISDSFLM